MRRPRILALLGLALAVATATAGPAPAAEGPGFAISAVGFPSYFTLEGRPGSVLVGQVMVSNPTGRSQSVRLAAVDVRTADTGGLAYAIKARFREGGWVRLQRRALQLAPGARVAVPFQVSVPRGARPGEHFAGIVAQEPRPRRATQGGPRSQVRLLFVSRLAIAVQVRVPGTLRRGMRFEDARFDITPSGVRLLLGLRSTGNALIKQTRGSLAVTQGSRRLMVAPVRIDSFVPGSAIRFPIRWTAGAVRGSYRVRGLLRPQGARPVRIDTEVNFGRRQAGEYRKATGRKAQGGTPLWIYAALVLALGGATAFAIAYARMCRRVGTRA